MQKTCSRCGKIHPYNYKCTYGRTFVRDDESRERGLKDWKHKREEIKQNALYLCEVCIDEGIYTYNDLEVHHITKIRDDKSLMLDNYNLICLCQRHHKQADKGIIDADYLRSLAKKREDGTM